MQQQVKIDEEYYRLKSSLEEVVREEISAKIQEGVCNVCPLGLGCS